jgi:hypothetical protein
MPSVYLLQRGLASGIASRREASSVKFPFRSVSTLCLFCVLRGRLATIAGQVGSRVAERVSCLVGSISGLFRGLGV